MILKMPRCQDAKMPSESTVEIANQSALQDVIEGSDIEAQRTFAGK